jgi:hypothetical protein
VRSREFLIIADAVAPLSGGESPLSAIGLSRALAAAGHRTTVLSLGTASAVERVPGLARRLRTIRASVGDESFDLNLHEGKAALSNAQLLVIEAEPGDRGRTAALLGSAVKSLSADGLIAPEVTIGWGETSAIALSATSAAIRLFALPSGRLGPDLSEREAQVTTRSENAGAIGAFGAIGSLAALGSLSANAIIAPSPSAARAVESDPGLAARAADEPFVALRFGCDDPPYDPASDPALPVSYSAAAPEGKLECRRALARRCSLALGPRTLLLSTAPLRANQAGEAILGALGRLASYDVAVAIPGSGDQEMVDRAKVLAIEHPGRIAVVGDDDPTEERRIRAASDAMLFGDDDDRTGRAAGTALLYGTLPIVVDTAASRDYLVDYDPGSATGSAILFESAGAFEIESAIRRAIALRADSDLWVPLVKGLFGSAPRWANSAAILEEVCATYDLPAA